MMVWSFDHRWTKGLDFVLAISGFAEPQPGLFAVGSVEPAGVLRYPFAFGRASLSTSVTRHSSVLPIAFK